MSANPVPSDAALDELVNTLLVSTCDSEVCFQADHVCERLRDAAAAITALRKLERERAMLADELEFLGRDLVKGGFDSHWANLLSRAAKALRSPQAEAEKK